MDGSHNQIDPDQTISEPIITPPPIDALIDISINTGEVEACLRIRPPQNGGAPPSLETIKEALAKYGVIYNVNEALISKLVLEPVYNHNFIIAQGIAPVDGIDGTAEFHIETGEKTLKPKQKSDGTVDHLDLGLVENVRKGQILCSLTFPTEGAPGISVKGKALPQKKGRPAANHLGKNTCLNEEGTAIISQIDGQAEFNGQVINVHDTFFIRGNVDISTGNINVIANVVVTGMVLSGFEIEAGGNIEVGGVVEAATIKAGGDIKLKGGIIGSELYCQGNLKSRFIENCHIFVKGDINSECILHSQIKCGKDLKVEGRIAKIIGGYHVVGKNIEANTIGSVADVNTTLELGTDPTVIERQQELLAQVPELEKQINNIEPLLTLLRQLEAINRLSEEKMQILTTVSENYEANNKLLQEIKTELNQIAELLKQKGYGRITCPGIIYAGTKVIIGTASLSISETVNNASLFYKEGNICIGTAR